MTKGRDKKPSAFDLVQIQAKAAGDAPRKFWRGLDQLADSEEYRAYAASEFPNGKPGAVSPGMSRRDVLRLMAVSTAVAGLAACTKLPTEKIVPYAQQRPEDFVPGKPIFYATAMPFGGYANGLLVESNMGRPTKAEGNPDHPASLGATDIFSQAAPLGLYDPDRAQLIRFNGRMSDWSRFLVAMNTLRLQQLEKQGAGFRLLTETISSPTMAEQIQTFLKQFPKAKWHQWEPCTRDNAREGSRLAFGQYLNTTYRFDKADVVLSLDSDFLNSGPGFLRYARDFADKRRVTNPQSSMNRLYVAESFPTNTGGIADHRLPLKAAEIESLTSAIAAGLGVKDAAGQTLATSAAWVSALVNDLQKHQGASIIIVGDHQPPAVHALAHAMNAALGNIGKTVFYTDPVEAAPTNQLDSLRELANDIKSGQVDSLFIVSANPVFTAPPEFDFAELLLRVKTRIHTSLYVDETSVFCNWHIPEAHFLESWGDCRAFDGTVSIIQPLIDPLYLGKSPHELLAVLSGDSGQTDYSIVRGYWQRQKGAKDFEAFWQKSLNDGVVAGTAFPAKQVKLNDHLTLPAPTPASGGLEVVFRPDPTVWDGRFANLGWLQELPKPITKLTWDNAAFVSIKTAQQLGVENGSVVKLRYEGREVKAPVWIMPGQPNQSVTLHLGYGRKRAGQMGSDIGFNAYSFRTAAAQWIGSGLDIQKTGDSYQLVSTQHHHIIDSKGKASEEESKEAFNRDLIRIATLEEYRKNPEFAKDPAEKTTKAESLYPPHPYNGLSWGLSIDLTSCVGCNSCVVACQSENNIPVVGKDQVRRGREMHWIRVDTYFRGNLDNPETYNEIVPCMHCENTPCEYVCPVGATVHSPEGLNEMVYNRCVGTRYCSNNCPYKVRRFNFKLFQDWTTPSLYALRNPDVTVRSRGVMEKCTYCIQRINRVKFAAEKEDREIRDGEIQTACQQVCPTKAIVFGNINDSQSQVSKAKAQDRNYGLLAELNVRPRTTYLARLRNPNPKIKE